MLPGIDISVANDSPLTHADDIDFAKVYAAGKRFVYAKAVEGESVADPQFRTFIENASKTPLLLGAYAFVYSDENPADDVDGFLRYTDPVKDKLTLAPWYDLEVRNHRSAQQIVDFMGGYLTKLVAARGCGLVLYSGLNFLKQLIADLGGPASAGAQFLVQFPLAVAAYTISPVFAPAPWTSWTFHQWAASAPGGPIGRCDGIQGMVDLNWFNGDDMSWLSCR